MFKHERINRVLELLRARGFCSVEELVAELRYSPATIRRDLTFLAQRGLIEKSYGGACFIHDKVLAVREHQYTDAKTRICLAAENLVRDGDSVFVDGTTTTYFLRDILIKKKRLSVVTTNLKLAVDLCDGGVKCFVPGGQVCDTAMLGGPLAAEALGHFDFDVSFFSPGTVRREGTIEFPQLFWDSVTAVMAHSRKKVCLYHKSKFDVPAFYRFGSLGDFDTVISNAEFPPEFAEKFPDTGFIWVQ